MVKKLLKHEFLAYFRVWIPMQLILLAVALSGRILQLFETDSSIYTILLVTSVIVYIVAIIASFGLTFVFGIVRFYKHLFTSEGYLSFTLPVTTSQHLRTKLVTSGTFNILTVAAIFLSILIRVPGRSLSTISQAIKSLIHTGYTYAGTNMTVYMIEFAALLLLALFTQLLQFYACVSLGQLFRKNRVAGAVIVYFIYYAIVQVISTFFSILLVLTNTLAPLKRIALFISGHPLEMVHVYLCGMFALQLLLSAAFYLISSFVMRRKLNLE